MDKLLAAAFACAILSAPSAHAAECHKAADTVTVTGKTFHHHKGHEVHRDSETEGSVDVS